MLKSFRGKCRTKYQAWLDGTPRPMFEPTEPTPKAPAAPRSVAGRPNPYAGLAVLREPSRPVMYEHPSVADPAYREPSYASSVATPKQRAYEAALPDWAREALADMDRVIAVVLDEAIDETRTPQYVRRHRRNLREVLDDGMALTEDADPGELASRIVDRARRASDPDVTGIIPTVPAYEVSEEAWA